MVKLYLHHSRSVTGFHIKTHYYFIFNHLLFTNLFVQAVRFAMGVKPLVLHHQNQRAPTGKPYVQYL